MNGKYLENCPTEPDIKVWNEVVGKGTDQQLEATIKAFLEEVKYRIGLAMRMNWTLGLGLFAGLDSLCCHMEWNKNNCKFMNLKFNVFLLVIV